MRKLATAKPPSESRVQQTGRHYHDKPAGYLPGQRDWEPGHRADGLHECVVTEHPAVHGLESAFDRYEASGYTLESERSPTKRIYTITIDEFNARRKRDEDKAAAMRRSKIVTATGAIEKREQLSLSETELIERVEAARAGRADQLEDN
jgi:hypothetical protein